MGTNHEPTPQAGDCARGDARAPGPADAARCCQMQAKTTAATVHEADEEADGREGRSARGTAAACMLCCASCQSTGTGGRRRSSWSALTALHDEVDDDADGRQRHGEPRQRHHAELVVDAAPGRVRRAVAAIASAHGAT